MTPVLPAPFTLCRYDSIGSTNDEARRLAEEGAAHGTVVWALEQSAGRGRMDRQWLSPRGNLFMSVVLRLPLPAAQAALTGFAAALAVAETVAGFVPADAGVGLKWPNDVLLDGGKVAGLLLEASAPAAGGLDWLVLGIGINLAWAPEAALYPTASLAQCTDPPAPALALERRTAALARRLGIWEREGFAPIRRDWLARAHPAGTRLTVRHGGQAIDGTFVDLDSGGDLVLATPGGLMRITAGDVHLPALKETC